MLCLLFTSVPETHQLFIVTCAVLCYFLQDTDWAGLLHLVTYYKSRRFDANIGLPKYVLSTCIV